MRLWTRQSTCCDDVEGCDELAYPYGFLCSSISRRVLLQVKQKIIPFSKTPFDENIPDEEEDKVAWKRAEAEQTEEICADPVPPWVELVRDSQHPKQKYIRPK